MTVTALLCVALSIPAFFAMPWFVHLLAVPPELSAEVVRYGRFSLPGFVATAFFMLMSIMVRATGDSTFMMRCLMVYCAVLAVATPAAIVGGLGVPGLGAAGSERNRDAGQWLPRHVAGYASPDGAGLRLGAERRHPEHRKESSENKLT